jgi:hypothetical protein
VPDQRSIGEFTSERPAEEEFPLAGLHFVLDGEKFAFEGADVNVLRISELAQKALAEHDDESNAASMAGLGLSLKTAMGSECRNPRHGKRCPGEYWRLMGHIDAHNTPVSVVIDIVQMVNEAAQQEVEASTGRPTQRQSGSSGGLPGRDAQLSRLMSADQGDFAVEGDYQPQPPAPDPSIQTLRLTVEKPEPVSLAAERAEQEASRRKARNAATGVRTRPPAKKGSTSKGRRTA